MFENSRFEDRLRRWPYAYRQLLQTPKAELIESHAISHLCRALNIGRVTAFVGSGASMAYGRISWSDMIYVTQKAVFQRYDRNKEQLEKYRGFERIEALRKLLNEHQVERTEPNAAQQLIAFQLAEELDHAIDRGLSASKPPHGTKSEQHSTFRTTIMWLTHDDRGHAEQLLRDALLDTELDADSKSSNRTATAIDDLIESGLWGSETGEDREIPKIVSRDFPYPELMARPLERYRIGAELRKMPADERWNVVKSLTEAADGARQSKPPKNEKRRGDKIDPARDPLLIVLDSLEIRRFLTLNYDSEIELLFEEKGFVRAANPDAAKASSTITDPRAYRYTDVVFSRDKTADLITLTIRDKRPDAWVVHLHGRAELGERNAFLVATDEDYRARYAQIDDKRPILDDAVRLAFGASPILFLGIGMEEVDLLRPLREFMSGRTGFNDRLVVALLPYNDSARITGRQKIEFLRKYGVYTIHYGLARLSKGEKEKPWLATLNTTRKALDAFLNELTTTTAVAESTAADTPYEPRGKVTLDVLVDSTRWENDAEKRQSAWKSFLDRLEEAAQRIRGLSCPEEIEGQDITAETDIRHKIIREIGEINGAVEFAETLKNALKLGLYPSPPTDSQIAEWSKRRREANAHKVLVAGAANALKTTALSARLARLQKEWNDWRADFFELPRPRSFISKTPIGPIIIDRHNKLDRRNKINLTTISRHWIELPSVEAKKYGPLMERFYAGAPSQTFNYLISGITGQGNIKACQGKRRIFLLISSRGAGKGHFFSALQQAETNGRLGNLLRLICPKETTEYNAAFFNLSFSVEVSSIFDRIAEFLWNPSEEPPLPEGQDKADRATSATEPPSERASRDWKDLSGNRLERLRFALKSLASKQRASQRRFLIAFNAINMLFDRHGAPKNRQFGELFDILMDSEDAPIDFVFICSGQTVPRQFRNGGGDNGPPDKEDADDQSPGKGSGHPKQKMKMRLLTRKNSSEKERLAVDSMMTKLDISLAEGANEPINNFVHVLHPARASVVLNAFFPSVALLLAWWVLDEAKQPDPETGKHDLLADLIDQPNASRFNVMDPRHAREIRANLKKSLGADSKAGAWLVDHQRQILPYVMLAATLLFEIVQGHAQEPHDVSGLVEKLNKLRLGSRKNKRRVESLEEVRAALLGILRKSDQLKDKDKELDVAFRKLARALDDKMRSMYEAVSDSRFAFTLWMATAYEILFDAIGPKEPGNEKPPTDDEIWISQEKYDNDFKPRAREAINFIKRTIEKLQEHASQSKEAMLIDLVFAQLKTLHELERKIPVSVPASIVSGLALYELQNTILWHLAVIAIPIEADVLARCPLIREAIDRAWKDKSSLLKDDNYKACVEGTMPLLVTRCLAFKLSAFGNTKNSRYGIHRSLQGHFFRKMGAPFVDYSEVDQFSLTLYADQPDAVPKLSPIAHRDLRRTVWALSGYPEDDELADIYDTVGKEHELRGRMLRAAYGIVRSIYSVSSLARFNVEHEQIDVRGGATLFSGSPGIFEEHRRQIRWLLKEAVELTREKRAYVPFYAEEIAWLYNESGILSLAQGCLSDAVALFHLADRAARRIEASETGPLRALILVNRSVAEIERGRLGWARNALERIIGAVDYRKDRDTHVIAKGYLALIHHLRGNTDEALKLYETVVNDLTRREKSRAAAIFSRHYADLLRNSGQSGPVAAQGKLAIALRLSAEGHHEDVRQLTMLSRARLLLGNLDASKSAEIHAILSSVERYACVMGMPRLLSDIEEIRAGLYRRNGDLRSAGTAAANGLEIASLNELRLRKASCLAQLAAINFDRGFVSECEILRNEALALAEDIGYEAALVAAHSLGHRLRGGAPGRPSES